MTKYQCYSNLFLILFCGILLTAASNHLSNVPDYMKLNFWSFLGGLIGVIFPALIVLLIGTVIQWFKKSGRETTNPHIDPNFVTYSYTYQIEESKKKMKTWEENFIGKLDKEVKSGWKTIFIITWIVFLIINIMAIYGNWMLIKSI